MRESKVLTDIRNSAVSNTGNKQAAVTSDALAPLLQGLMEGQGWRDQRGEILAKDQQIALLEGRSKQAAADYDTAPTTANRAVLMAAWMDEIAALSAERDAAQMQQRHFETKAEQAAKTQLQAKSSQGWGEWLMGSLKSWVSATPEQAAQEQAQYYAGLVAKKQARVDQLQSELLRLRAEAQTALSPLMELGEDLGLPDHEEQTAAEQESIEDIISPLSRRLLQTATSPIGVSQYCYPTGACELSSLYDGASGFVLQGEAVSDNSGVSVSAAGDVNGDGIADLVVGAYLASPSGRSNAGKSYVVFGSRNATAWNNGILELSSLSNGVRGFMLQGEAATDKSGVSVSGAGDVNGDGIADLVVGAYTASPSGRSQAGKSYVVFGSRNATMWGNGTLNLSSLRDGVRGFELQGEAAGDYSGRSVSAAGDINGDGVADLVVGAYGASPSGRTNAGKSYVVFGSRNVTAWGNGTLELSSLHDGMRGFVLQGEAAGDYSGYSVSAAGDVNGDGAADLVVGAYAASPSGRLYAGKSYVVFGSRNATAWGNGVLELSSLCDGVHGFVLQGEAASDNSGVSVSAAGDVNSDGIADLVVGAYQADPSGRSNAGKSYVVFGSRNVTAWGNGTLELGNLGDGVRGFVLQGEAASDNSGVSVSGGGDINGDSVADLVVGAYLADPSGRSQAGQSYVVFGSRDATAWGNGVLELSSLYDGARGFVLQGEAASDNSGVSVSGGGDINGDSVADLVVGAYLADPSGRSQAGQSYVVFGTPSLSFTANNLRLAAGDTVRLNNTMLAITNTSLPITIYIESANRGAFTWVNSTTPLTSFVLQDLDAGRVQFIHDGSLIAPTYRLSPEKTNLATIYSDAQIDFLGAAPILGNNQLSVDQGSAAVVTAADLSASDRDTALGDLVFEVSNVQHGQFNVYNATGDLLMANVSAFSQQAVYDQQVQFVHDGARAVPSYSVAVSDLRSTTASRNAIMTFNYAPQLNTTRMLIDQGQPTTLRPQDMSATDVETFDEDIIIEVGNVTHGYFAYSSNPTFEISTFRQSSVITGGVQFTQDGSNSNASFAIRAYDGRIYSPWQVAQTQLNRRPVLQRNLSDVTVTQGESFHFDLGSNLFADPDGEALNYTAQLQGNAPLPRGLEFIPPSSFQGNLPTLTSYQIEVQAQDPRGLKASTDFALQPQAPSQSGINLQALYTSVSSIGGIAVAIAGYFWLRRKTTAHRRGFELANNLRKAANLEYHDFMRFDGDVFKSKVENLLGHVDSLQKGFYKSLTPEQRKSFAVCIAEILEKRHLLKPSDYGMGIYGWMLAFSVGWSQQLDFKKFESQLDDIAKQAFTAWQAEASPTTRWQYFSPTCKDKVNAFCCARPSRAGMFARDKVRLSRSEGVSLTDLKDSKHQVIDMPSSSQKDVLETTAVASSPRFFDHSAATSEERLGLIEKQVQSHMQQVSGQLHQVSESMQYMHQGMQQIAGNVKTIHDEVEQLKAETRPLLGGMSSSTASH